MVVVLPARSKPVNGAVCAPAVAVFAAPFTAAAAGRDVASATVAVTRAPNWPSEKVGAGD